MTNFGIIILISLILIRQNILLLNEETLILICFIVFVWIVFTKVNESFNFDLIQRTKKIEKTLVSSLEKILKSINQNLKTHQEFKNLVSHFKNLASHFFKLSSAISNELPFYLSKKSQITYSKKFIFIRHLEQQTIKLLILLISRKLSKFIFIQQFYAQNLKLPNFLCFQSINLLKYIKNI